MFDCELKPKMNCFNCEIGKSCQDCSRKKNGVAECLVEIKILKRQPENELGYMLPYFKKIENNIIIEKPVQKEMKKCSKCETEKNPNNYIKSKTFCRIFHNENMRNRRKK